MSDQILASAVETLIGGTSGQVIVCQGAGQPVTTAVIVSNATHTGDATGSTALTLATVNSNVGTFGSSTQVACVTVNGKGLVTAASAVTATPAVGSITGLGTGVSTLLAGTSSGTGGPAGTASPTFTGTVSLAALTASGIVTTNDVRSPGATRVNVRASSAGGSVALQTSNGIDVVIVTGHNAPAVAIGGSVSFPLVNQSITTNTNDLTRPSGLFVRVNCNPSSDLTGITAGSDGSRLNLINIGSGVLTLKHESASSAAANRFLMVGAADIALSQNEWALCWYDSTTARWRVRKV